MPNRAWALAVAGRASVRSRVTGNSREMTCADLLIRSIRLEHGQLQRGADQPAAEHHEQHGQLGLPA